MGFGGFWQLLEKPKLTFALQYLDSRGWMFCNIINQNGICINIVLVVWRHGLRLKYALRFHCINDWEKAKPLS